MLERTVLEKGRVPKTAMFLSLSVLEMLFLSTSAWYSGA